jgi:hypothetical protein
MVTLKAILVTLVIGLCIPQYAQTPISTFSLIETQPETIAVLNRRRLKGTVDKSELKNFDLFITTTTADYTIKSFIVAMPCPSGDIVTKEFTGNKVKAGSLPVVIVGENIYIESILGEKSGKLYKLNSIALEVY